MTTQRTFIIGYTNHYGEEIALFDTDDFDEAMVYLNRCRGRNRVIDYRMWEEVGVGAGA